MSTAEKTISEWCHDDVKLIFLYCPAVRYCSEATLFTLFSELGILLPLGKDTPELVFKFGFFVEHHRYDGPRCLPQFHQGSYMLAIIQFLVKTEE